MQKIRNSIHYRLPIWQRMLTRQEGVSIAEMVDACSEFIGESEDHRAFCVATLQPSVLFLMK